MAYPRSEALAQLDASGPVPTGPAMSRLTEKQQQFVWQMACDPHVTQAECARRAGYSDTKEAAKVTAHHLMRDPRIIDALHEVAGYRLKRYALVAAEVLIRITQDEKAGRALQARCAESLLNRVGLGFVQQVSVSHTHADLTGVALLERIRGLAKQFPGLDVDKLLAGRGEVPRETKVIEGVAEPVGDVRAVLAGGEHGGGGGSGVGGAVTAGGRAAGTAVVAAEGKAEGVEE